MEHPGLMDFKNSNVGIPTEEASFYDTALTLISRKQVGNLVGQLKELMEASISNEVQCNALKNVIADKAYAWWYDNGDKVTQEEGLEAITNHWKSMTGSSSSNHIARQFN